MAATRKGKSIWPAPVYVAQFAGGETVRMSYWQPIGKPLRQEAARKLACEVIGFERRRIEKNYPLRANYGLSFGVPTASDIIAGHTERKDAGHEGEIIPDPFFAPAAEPMPWAKRAKAGGEALELRVARAALADAAARIAELENALAWERRLTMALAA